MATEAAGLAKLASRPIVDLMVMLSRHVLPAMVSGREPARPKNTAGFDVVGEMVHRGGSVSLARRAALQ